MTTRTIRVSAAALALGVVAATLVGCGGRRDNTATDSGGEITCEAKPDTRVGIATGNTTGVYFALGTAYAEQVYQATDGRVTATAAETGASVQNIQQLVAGTYDVALSVADTAADAVAGRASFEGKKQPIAALARIHTNYVQVIVRTDAGITTVADLRGKRISTGSPKSGTEVIANRLLQAAGLDPQQDLAAQRLDLTKTVDGLKDGSLDGLIWTGGLPTPGITDLLTTARDKVRFLDVTPLLEKMKSVNPVYEAGVIPAADYGLSSDLPTITAPNLMLVRADFDANLACVLTKVLFDRKDTMAKTLAVAKELNEDLADQTGPVPLHRGAVAALKSRG
jgi:TRAP transporter TAXI family solute receptor